LKISKKKFIYLISPNKIPNSFYKTLNLVLKTKKVSFFQLRLKNYSLKKKIIIGKKIKNICKKNKVKFIINDNPSLALKLNADGCHLGQKDMNINIAKKIQEDFLNMIKEGSKLNMNSLSDTENMTMMSLSGVKRFPMRVKCATLAWHTFVEAIEGNKKIVNTEN